MKQTRAAFTMIELVFVIVILGILAAVAIPKLTATRNDATVAKTGQNIMTGLAEVASYAMAQSKAETNLTVMSQVFNNMNKVGEATVVGNEAKVKAGDVPDCVIVTIDINTTTGVDTLNVNFANAGNDSSCLGLQTIIDPSKYPMKLRGNSVTY